MKVTLQLGQDRKLVIPDEVVESLHLEPGARVEIEVREATDEQQHRFDQQKFDAAARRYSGSMREQMLADGYNSVDEMMDEIRPRW